MNPHIIFKIKGLHGISVSGNENQFKGDYQGNIYIIDLLLEDVDIVGIKVTFSENVLIDKVLTTSIYKLIELFVVSMIGEFGATTIGLEINIENIYNPNYPTNDEPIQLNSNLCLRDSLSITDNYPITQYKELFSQLPTTVRKMDAYIVLENIMKIDNIAIRYLMQYEFLMSLVSLHKKQRDVTKFIRNTYNPTQNYNTIGFHATRRTGRNFDEDDISYYRNILAHNDTTVRPSDIEERIKHMSVAIVRVIYFALKDMPE